MSAKRLGVLGGTFDPPHIGHLMLAAEAQAQLGLVEVLWVLTPDPPHKQGQSISLLPARLEMLLAALGDFPSFRLSRVDIDRSPPHYAVDTMSLLQGSMPGAQLIYLMGSDSLRDLPTWRNPAAFVQACAHIGVMRRPGVEEANLQNLDAAIPGLAEKVVFIETPWLEISSSDIRRRVNAGCPYRYLLPQPVYEVVNRLGLYR